MWFDILKKDWQDRLKRIQVANRKRAGGGGVGRSDKGDRTKRKYGGALTGKKGRAIDNPAKCMMCGKKVAGRDRYESVSRQNLCKACAKFREGRQ